MLKLVKYSLGSEVVTGGTNKGAASVLDEYNDSTTLRDKWTNPSAKITGASKTDNITNFGD